MSRSALNMASVISSQLSRAKTLIQKQVFRKMTRKNR
jgi:hypothetical protein